MFLTCTAGPSKNWTQCPRSAHKCEPRLGDTKHMHCNGHRKTIEGPIPEHSPPPHCTVSSCMREQGGLSTQPSYIHAVPSDGGMRRHKDTQSRAIQRAGRGSSHSALKEGGYTPGTSSSGRPLLPSHEASLLTVSTLQLLPLRFLGRHLFSGPPLPTALPGAAYRKPYTVLSPLRSGCSSRHGNCAVVTLNPAPQRPHGLRTCCTPAPGYAGTPMLLVWAWG